MPQTGERAAAELVEPSTRGPVLVAYASRYGSTRGIAERIADRLRAAGVRADVRAAGEVGDVADYRAAVVGSAVFDQRWMPEARALIDRNREALAGLPVWLFSVGTFGDRKRLIGRLVKREPQDIGEITRAVHARDYRVFAGIIDRERWPRASRALYHAFGGRLGDNRDWPEIEAWADGISRALRVDARPDHARQRST